MSDREDRGRYVPPTRIVLYGLVGFAGILASTLHWSGILFGGILVGLLAPSLKRGILYGAGFGLVVWIVFLFLLVTAGIRPGAETIQIWGVSVAVPVVLGGIGGTARELRPVLEPIIPD